MADASVHTPQPDPFGRPTSYCYRCLMTWPCEVSGLLARIEQLEQENAALNARLDQLRAALREYGDHRIDCATRQMIGTDRVNAILKGWVPAPPATVCDCGFAALAGGEG